MTDDADYMAAESEALASDFQEPAIDGAWLAAFHRSRDTAARRRATYEHSRETVRAVLADRDGRSWRIYNRGRRAWVERLLELRSRLSRSRAAYRAMQEAP